jgi:CDP-glucose 4,6-dehydratase
LINLGANVFGLIRNDKNNTFLKIEGLCNKITVIKGDLVNKDLISNIISENSINFIYHLAAQVEVGVGLRNPFLTYETNVRGTYSLLEAVRQFPDEILGVIIASSDKAYGSYPEEMMPYKEDYPLIPKYPYDTSKACADLIAQAYSSDAYNLPIVVTRFSNIFGPGQLNFSAIFPDAIRSALGYSKFEPRSNGNFKRDFIYVTDVAYLYIRIAEELSKNPAKIRSEIFNAGTNRPISIKEIIKKIYNLIGNKSDLEKVLHSMKEKKPMGEIPVQSMDYEKVEKYFNWKPTIELETGIQKSIDWYKEYFDQIKNS